MSFWQERVGVSPAAPAPAPAPASNLPWWLPQAAPQQPQHPVQAPSQAEARAVLNGLAEGSVTPAGESHLGDLLQQSEYTTERAQSAKNNELCPECTSGNYMSPAGNPNAMKQCFNCGYNPRFAHSTAGTSGIGQSNVEAPRAARVQRNTPPTGFPKIGSVVHHM